MDPVLYFVIGVHLLGIILQIFYLCRWFTDHHDSLDSKAVRSAYNCNLVILYCVINFTVEIVLIETLHFTTYYDEESRTKIDAVLKPTTMFIYLSAMFFAIYTGPSDHRANIGHINAQNAFALASCIAFWINVPNAVLNGASGFRTDWLPLVVFYVFMFREAWQNLKENTASSKAVLTKSEAVSLINRHLEKPPSVEWTVNCGHLRSWGNDDVTFVEQHSDEGNLVFHNDSDWTLKNPSEPPESLFRGQRTSLRISTEVKLLGPESRRVVDGLTEQLRQTHQRHAPELNLTMKTFFVESYLVCNEISFSSECCNDTKWRVMFALLGLSLPYRWINLLVVRHIDYRITKFVHLGP